MILKCLVPDWPRPKTNATKAPRIKLNRTPQYHLQELRRSYGASRFSQVYTDNIVILQFKNLDNLCSSVSKKGNSYTIKLN